MRRIGANQMPGAIVLVPGAADLQTILLLLTILQLQFL